MVERDGAISPGTMPHRLGARFGSCMAKNSHWIMTKNSRIELTFVKQVQSRIFASASLALTLPIMDIRYFQENKQAGMESTFSCPHRVVAPSDDMGMVLPFRIATTRRLDQFIIVEMAH